MTRRVPRWSDVRHLVRVKPFTMNPTDRRLASAFTIEDLRRAAQRRVPRSVFDYTDGAAERELSLKRARDLFGDLEFVPSILRDVSDPDLATTVVGIPSALPLVLAPTGFTRMMNHQGEKAVSAAARDWEIAYVLSTMGTTSIEELASAPHGPLMFQLYVSKDHAVSSDLMDRARAAGYRALVLTVDVPVSGARLRDARNGFGFPPALGVKTLLDGALHPQWTFNMLTTEPLAFSSLSRSPADIGMLMKQLFDPSLTMADLEWIRDHWDGPLIVKGVQSLDDAKALAKLGVQGIVLSNHGGRQLDRAPIPMRLLPDVADAIGADVEVSIDTGILSGADIVACLALGARYTFVGRAYLYGLMAGGDRGVRRALQILGAEVTRTLQLLGVSRIDELRTSHVKLP